MNRLTIDQAFGLLGLTQQSVSAVVNAIPDDADDVWNLRTEAFRRLIKDARKETLRRVHPDVCKDHDATEKAKLVNRVADELLQVRIGPKPRPRPVVIFNVTYTSTTYHTSASTSNW